MPDTRARRIGLGRAKTPLLKKFPGKQQKARESSTPDTEVNTKKTAPASRTRSTSGATSTSTAAKATNGAVPVVKDLRPSKPTSTTTSTQSQGTKRKREQNGEAASSPVKPGSARRASDSPSEDFDLSIWQKMNSNPTRKYGSGSQSASQGRGFTKNIHAASQKNGRATKSQQEQRKQSGEQSGFQKPRDIVTPKARSSTEFQLPSALSIPKRTENVSVEFVAPKSSPQSLDKGSQSDGEVQLSTLPSSEAIEIEAEDLGTIIDPTDPRCPVCGTSVSVELLKQYADELKHSWKGKARVHKAHRTLEATEQWKEQGYPAIAWATLEERFPLYKPRLMEVLLNREQSRFRTELAAHPAGDGSRLTRVFRGSAHDALDNDFTSAGYYGGRGADLMQHYLMRELAEELRERAATDQLVLTYGVAGYVQLVLVPELALMLVMDDIDVDADAAGKVMRESAKLGRLLNPGKDDMKRKRRSGDKYIDNGLALDV